jgi:predicted nucleotide-binding protein (sugar kinase/HSP70/actin superfamily)
MGQYNKMQRTILDELGHEEIPIVSPGAPESSKFFEEYDMKGLKGLGLLVRAGEGFLTIDLLEKMRRQTRPYEVNQGQTEEVYNRNLKAVCNLIEQEKSVFKVMRQMPRVLAKAREDFEQIQVTGEKKPKIGVIGEIYVRSHPFSNNELVRRIENLGGEAMLPPFGEWIDHTSATRKMDILTKQKDIAHKMKKAFTKQGREQGYRLRELFPKYLQAKKQYVLNGMLDRFVTNCKRKLEAPLRDFLTDKDEGTVYDIWDRAEPYIIKWFGEAALGIGKSIEWVQHGADGIINTMPFTCMPGIITAAVSKRVREDYKTPWLNLAFDGLEQKTTDTRLEAFMYQAHEYMKKKN